MRLERCSRQLLAVNSPAEHRANYGRPAAVTAICARLGHERGFPWGDGHHPLAPLNGNSRTNSARREFRGLTLTSLWRRCQTLERLPKPKATRSQVQCGSPQRGVCLDEPLLRPLRQDKLLDSAFANREIDVGQLDSDSLSRKHLSIEQCRSHRSGRQPCRFCHRCDRRDGAVWSAQRSSGT